MATIQPGGTCGHLSQRLLRQIVGSAPPSVPSPVLYGSNAGEPLPESLYRKKV